MYRLSVISLNWAQGEVVTLNVNPSWKIRQMNKLKEKQFSITSSNSVNIMQKNNVFHE